MARRERTLINVILIFLYLFLFFMLLIRINYILKTSNKNSINLLRTLKIRNENFYVTNKTNDKNDEGEKK